MSDTKFKAVGPGVLDLLTVAFVVLKLTGFISWSWWWVLAPTWIPWTMVVVVALLVVLVTYSKS